MVERSLSMREALGSTPGSSTFFAIVILLLLTIRALFCALLHAYAPELVSIKFNPERKPIEMSIIPKQAPESPLFAKQRRPSPLFRATMRASHQSPPKHQSVLYIRKAMTYDGRPSQAQKQQQHLLKEGTTGRIAAFQNIIRMSLLPQARNGSVLMSKPSLRSETRLKLSATSIQSKNARAKTKTKAEKRKMYEQFSYLKAALIRTEIARLQARETACGMKIDGESKKGILAYECFEMVASALDLPFFGAMLQAYSYELIGDLFLVYRDFRNAALYYCKGVLTLLLTGS